MIAQRIVFAAALALVIGISAAAFCTVSMAVLALLVLAVYASFVAGYCHACEARVEAPKRFCDGDCADDFDRKQRR